MTSSRVTAATARSRMPPPGASESTRLVAASTTAAAPITAVAASVHRGTRRRRPPRRSAPAVGVASSRASSASASRSSSRVSRSPSRSGSAAASISIGSRFWRISSPPAIALQQAHRPAARGRPAAPRAERAHGWSRTAKAARVQPAARAARAEESPSQATSISVSRSRSESPASAAARDLGVADALPRISGPGRHHRGGGEPPLEGEAAVGRSARVGQHPARDAVEPRERVRGHVVEPPPGDEERLGHHVGRHVGWSATKRIAADGRIVLAEDALESLIAGRLHEPVLCLEYVRQAVGDYGAQPVRVSAVSRPAVPGRPTARIADRRSATCLLNPPDVLRRAAGPVLLRRCYELRRRLPAPANPWAFLRTGPPRRGAAFTVGQSPPNAVERLVKLL